MPFKNISSNTIEVINYLELSPSEWESCRVQLLRLRWGPPPVDGRRLECSPNDLAAWRLEAGHVTVKTGKEEFVARAGDWLFLGVGYRKQEFSEDARLVSIIFRVNWTDSLRPLIDLRPGLLVSGAPELDHHLQIVRQRVANPVEHEWHFLSERCDFSGMLSMASWFHGWLAEALPLWRRHLPGLEAARDVDPRVEAAQRWLMQQSELRPLIDFSGAAEAAGLSSGHLNRLFLQHHHQTLHGFQEQRRMRYARQRLLEPKTRVKAVAYELGFHDVSKFSTWFRRFEQISPRKYRQKFFGA